ncbi:MAG: hypothetical protein HYT27_02895 [Parcubacteria group bacterium]|nr:hypothetical protein [Parcubacteria group bacterium]
MVLSKDHIRGKAAHGAAEHGFNTVLENWKNAVKNNDSEERAKYALGILSHLTERGRKLNDVVAEGLLIETEAAMIREDLRRA